MLYPFLELICGRLLVTLCVNFHKIKKREVPFFHRYVLLHEVDDFMESSFHDFILSLLFSSNG